MRSKIRFLGAIGDIHCEEAALSAALRFFEGRETDAVVSVGDLVDGPGDANRTIGMLIDADVLAVRGNHDRWILADEMRDLPDALPRADLDQRSVAFLSELPPTRTLLTSAGELLVCHGVGTDDMQTLTPDDEGYALETNAPLQRLLRGAHRLVLGGHTHRRMIRRIGEVTFVNAGTLARDDDPCLLWVDFERRLAEFHDLSPDGRVLGKTAQAF